MNEDGSVQGWIWWHDGPTGMISWPADEWIWLDPPQDDESSNP